MNKQGLRAFSLGMIFTVSILGTYYYSSSQDQTKVSDNAAKSQLEKDGYVVLTSADYQNMKKKVTNHQSAVPKAEIKKGIKKQQGNAAKNQIITYQLRVVSGMSSENIAKLLEENNIIENGAEFSRFLVSHQFQTKIQLGTYHLTNNMSYEEIAKLITK